MKQWYRHNDQYYIIHKQIKIADFSGKNGVLNMEMVKECRDILPNVDHVLRNESHFMFVETIQEAEIIEENDRENETLVEVHQD
jgi:hypothetical protein